MNGTSPAGAVRGNVFCLHVIKGQWILITHALLVSPTCGIARALRMKYFRSVLNSKYIPDMAMIQLDTQLHVQFKQIYITLTS